MTDEQSFVVLRDEHYLNLIVVVVVVEKEGGVVRLVELFEIEERYCYYYKLMNY